LVTQPGDSVYLGSILCNVHCWGVVSDIDTPSMMSATFEVLANDGAVTLDALVGPAGPAGENASIVKMQYTSSIDDPDDLPDNLLNNSVDIGKTYWIGNIVYMWDGTQFVQKAMGSAGPPGPVPIIHPLVQLLDPDDPSLSSSVTVSGTALNPSWLMKLKAPRGPQGENATIRDATDYSEVASGAPTIGQTVTWNGTDYAPASMGSIIPRLYSLPEAGFSSFTGITTRQTIGTFQLPPQDFEWTPMVFGQLRVVGIELDSDPLIIGCEVRLGHPTAGETVGRSFGNISTWSTIVPHYSSHGAPNDAITPDNDRAKVPKAHTGTEGTLYISIVNDGAFGAYNFDKKNAQLSVLVIPTGTEFGGS
jgi:hypothetical protein